MDKEFVSMKCLVRDENREAGIKRGSGELFILTHELADEMVERIVEAVMQRVANLEKGTWKSTACDPRYGSGSGGRFSCFMPFSNLGKSTGI